MPLQLNYTDAPTGVNIAASYWVVQVVHIDSIGNTVNATLNGYYSLAVKNAGKTAFRTATVIATFAQLGVAGSNTLAQFLNAIYTFAITYVDIDGNTPFAGAIIV